MQDTACEDKQQKTFVIPVGWSPNIGNAFFALGIQHLLRTHVSNARVELLSDQAAYLNFLPGKNYRKEPRTSLRYLDHIRPDYIVLCGSVLTRQLPSIWDETLAALTQAGTRLLLLGVGYYEYNRAERETCESFLRKYPPYVLISRDSAAFHDLAGFAEHAYDGIDGAYWTPDVFTPIPTALPPYVVLNFDKAPQPRLNGGEGSNGSSGKPGSSYCFEFDNSYWSLEFPETALRLTKTLGAAGRYPLSLLGVGNSKQETANGYLLVHTDHSINPLLVSKVFGSANSFAGDLPYSYLNLYAQARLTITDRIHAALVTLAYGGTALLITPSGRASIIERVGGGSVTRLPTQLDMARLHNEKQAQAQFLESIQNW